MAITVPTAAVVIALTGTSLDEATVDSIIQDALLIAEDCITTLSAARQTAALKWLSAHLIASTSDDSAQALSSTKLGDASETYARATTSNGITGTTYGQQAVAIAPCLARIGRAKASIQVLL